MADESGGRGVVALSAAEGKRPSISLPPRSTVESVFCGGPSEASPGPMTLVSSFFAEDPESECRSFSQLLAGAMASPAAVAGSRRFPPEGDDTVAARMAVETAPADLRGGGSSLNLGHSRPMNLMVSQSPFFTVPAGLSPGGLLDSPAMFSSNLGHFGISHQQALAQVTAQAAHSHVQMQSRDEHPPPISSASLSQPVSTTNIAKNHPVQSISLGTSALNSESALAPHGDQRSQPSALFIDKPADDGYNWRKYGQKQVKGSEFPRSYYKCTHPKCPVKKKVERSIDGQVTEIIYKGQHNHERPPPSRRSKEGAVELNGNPDSNNSEALLQAEPSVRSSNTMTGSLKRDRLCGHGASEQLSCSSDLEELGDVETVDESENGGELEQKRRSVENRVLESASHKTITEPRIIVQTTSEVDLLDDGYRWRKYGQKVVKGNPHPRSYYKCTTAGCNVRKHVERASTDPKAVITTYEGKHNHDVPVARNASSTAVGTVSVSQDMLTSNHGRSDTKNNVLRPIAVLQMKGKHEME